MMRRGLHLKNELGVLLLRFVIFEKCAVWPPKNSFLKGTNINCFQPNRTDIDGGMWLGGSDLETEGKWVWNMTGNILEYTNWMEGVTPEKFRKFQKIPEHSSTDCLQMWQDKGQWDDLNCSAFVQGNTSTPLNTLCELIYECNY